MGVIHTNISPDTIFVDANGLCVIGEFGESIVLPTSKHLRGAKLTIGGETQLSSNLYTAPELLGGSALYVFEESVDYWSLGLTIVTLVIGEKTLSGLKETFYDEDFQMDEIVREMRISLCPQSIVQVVSLVCSHLSLL
jgi:serine/threonine protein kinase